MIHYCCYAIQNMLSKISIEWEKRRVIDELNITKRIDNKTIQNTFTIFNSSRRNSNCYQSVGDFLS